MSSAINDLFVDFLLVVIFLVVVVVLITTVVEGVLVLAIQPWTSLVVSSSVEAIVCLCRALIVVTVGIEKILVDILVLVLVPSDMLLDVVLEAWLNHVVLVYSDVLALSRTFVLREIFLVDVRV